MSNTTNSLTWKMLETRWEKGFENLETEEQEVLALYWLEAETMNGSLSQFFWNSSGDLAPLALAGLTRLQCLKTAQFLNQSMHLINAENYPLDHDKRMIYLEKLEKSHGLDVFKEASDFITDLTEDFLPLAIASLEKRYTSPKWVKNKWFL
jgi:Domain of unknown function (DUF4375)